MSKQHYLASTYTAQTSVGFLIKRSQTLISEVVEPVLKAHGFTMIQYQILVWLRDGIVSNPRDICAQLRHDSGALTRVIDQMAERDFLRRARRDRDRRKIELDITSAGLTKVESLIPLVVDKLNLALKEFSIAEVQEFMRLLLKLNSTMQSLLELKAASEA
jgi:DNA-binding MarR family transcriptional regulator